MKIDFGKVRKILIIQFKPFGDVLLTTSYLEALRDRFQNAKIDFLVSEPYNQVLFNNPYLDEIIAIKEQKGLSYYYERISLFSKIWKRKYDLIIDQQNMNSSGQVVLFSGAKYRLGYADAQWSFAYNLKANRGKVCYSASRKFDILQPLGIKKRPYKLYYFIKKESIEYIDNWLKKVGLKDKKFLCFSPGSPVKKKKWKIENYAKLADLILGNTNYKVVLLWASNEISDALKMKELMKNAPIIAPKTNLNQGVAMLKQSKLLICNDGGLNHLSVAVDCPSLAIFGNTSPSVWSPAFAFKNHYHLYNAECDSKKDSSFGITPKVAFEKVMEILEK
ncbi:MAG: hypothetical protein DRH57_06335 [Candidatus Cloacimonadota bacterium]|nr:MAG: hypothetical protein DRH57_06335 [Candidatus Cloacimonadota bacterium]